MPETEEGLRTATREEVWAELQDVARPDSRFGWDFSSFIPDYEGSEGCANCLLELGEERGYEHWFITPDNNLDPLREELIKRDVPFVMPTYGIKRGFVHLKSSNISEEMTQFVGTLDGMNRYANRIPLEEMESTLDPFDCMVTGASFVTGDGLRMGKGHGFFDLEWAMMREVGLADASTDVVADIHDVQLLEDREGQALAEDHDTIVDVIVTPGQTRLIEDSPLKPKGLNWSLLDKEEVFDMPPLQTLWERAGKPQFDH